MKTFVLMAGGTGGHLFPAMALAQELRRRGHAIHLMTDHRVASYGQDFPADRTHIVPAATPSISNPIKFAQAGFTILGGIGVAVAKLRNIAPDAVIGFGGYPTFPPMIAARILGIPGILHEANVVLGRANKALIRFADVLATGFETVKFAETLKIERVVTGNPVRDRVRTLAGTPYPALSADGPVRILVFGGSQGARVFADLVPPAVAGLPEDLRHRLVIAQQCRPEDLDRVADAYRQARVNVELAPFFADLPDRLAGTHLVISRSGASTIADLTAIGRPAILVPLPGSLDADQKNNALVVEAAGGGWIAEQATLSPQSLGTRLATLLSDPATLQNAAAAARTLGQPRSVEKLADLAERLAGQGH
ncbi:UDP-diphospho-muramoylpentapeptide beta-N-acetylglucosaminyltransferase [Devosia geojensis]|uniref:UDP-N-acetylglucosamine--N-acetylmuramyl-(pentapeptide) pyrophosphoryl-undecaprenol N-acetylglucosamine transferase n=1 Tax=Devosia geojensis TaxID=443610 RepID=A0A0F5FXP7_9HYPH|nr:undecaprenyldiphospho-muramoylpentapeptide beta-N-acetylglucosaminyltransferase [Devosia geojensis]KKB12962.1 UDP-diphospho-muramoylpentapeptide beta-N-acetylglucosaminyltransferase [Devosia geojensis]